MAAHAGASLKTYFLVFIALMVLLALTVGAAYLHFGEFNILVAMAIAIVKATIIVMFFMHVKYRSGLIVLFACGGFYWLMVLLGLIMTDYMTREPWQPGIKGTAEQMHSPAPMLEAGESALSQEAHTPESAEE